MVLIFKIYLVNHPQDKAKFTVDGKNVTQLSTAVVQDLVAKYIGGIKSKSSTTIASETVKEVKYVAETPTNADLTDIERVEEALSLVSTLKQYDAYYKVLKHLGKLRFQISPEARQSEEDELAREARQLGY